MACKPDHLPGDLISNDACCFALHPRTAYNNGSSAKKRGAVIIRIMSQDPQSVLVGVDGEGGIRRGIVGKDLAREKRFYVLGDEAL